ncbi:DUF6527 family protein [Acuticoccus yangtzensis]|uniref:DUF6527 family protein n=1 Tax=Acuticoccus yangtzensis TaxID=1443441 RepID=UPI0034E1A4B7
MLRRVLEVFRLIPRSDLSCRIASRHPSPEQVVDAEVVLVVRDPSDKWACFPCPCGCGETTKLSLNPTRKPGWQIRIDRLNRPTISPSVRQTSGCLSHYWVRGGRVEWCHDTGRAQREGSKHAASRGEKQLSEAPHRRKCSKRASALGPRSDLRRTFAADTTLPVSEWPALYLKNKRF